MIGVAGSFGDEFLLGGCALASGVESVTKEETPLTFFTLLACYSTAAPNSRMRAALCGDVRSERNQLWPGSGSQYILHLLGLNALAWFLAGENGAESQAVAIQLQTVFSIVMFLTFVLVNPVVSLAGQLQCHLALAPS
jgi:hypothetical protein